MDNELEELSALLSDCEESDKATSSKIPVKHEKCDEKNKLKKLHDFDIFNREQDTPQSTEKILPSLSQLFGKNSAIHEGDTDSSEDEDNRNASEPKYNDSGRAIKHLITKQDEPTTSRSKSSSWKSKTTLFAPSETPKTSGAKPQKDIFMDPFFGLRIVTPLISSQILKDKMQGRTAVRFNGLQNHLTNLDKSKDWVLGGVITSRFMKTSQKGTPYAIWILSDLREDMKTVSVFLFGKAYKNLWKTNTHIAVAILNPTPLENRKTSNDIAALSVNDADQVMILGQSKDLGTCKAKKKNGEPCTAMVNVTECDYCIYHVKEAYRKFNARSELQAPSGGSLTNLKNKVLGKNEVFYAGKIFTGRVAKPTRKQVVKDKKRLSQLFNQCESRLGPQTQATQEVKSAQSARVMLMKDAARLQKLTGSPATLNALALGDKSGSKKDSTDGKNSRQILPEKMESGDNLKPLRLPMKMEELKCNEKQTGNTNQDKNCGIAPQGNPKPPGKPIKNTSDGLELEICGTDKSAETGCRKSAHHGSRKLNPDRSLIKNKKSNQQTLDIHDKLKSGIVSKPTKDRFDNLIKLQSVSSKRNKSDAACENFPVECSKDSVQNICLRPNSTITNVSHSVSENLPVKRTKDSININSPKPKNDVNNPDRENFPVKRLRDLVHTDSPRLSNFGAFNFSVPSQHSAAKMKALKYVEKKGPICKENEKKSKSNKRKRADEAEEESASPKSTLSARFLELMNATSKHTDLITVAEDNEMEAYYDKMEKKEKMEEKMLNTYKVDCKAVRCLKCNYKWFSASEKCKTEKHPIKVISAVKRFFKCSNCSNRTCTLELIPLHNCKNCQNGHWVRTSMMKERKSATVPLSIRGGEQKFTNSVVTDTNLDLLVPDE